MEVFTEGVESRARYCDLAMPPTHDFMGMSGFSTSFNLVAKGSIRYGDRENAGSQHIIVRSTTETLFASVAEVH